MALVPSARRIGTITSTAATERIISASLTPESPARR
jgi:hypothetical protein